MNDDNDSADTIITECAGDFNKTKKVKKPMEMTKKAIILWKNEETLKLFTTTWRMQLLPRAGPILSFSVQNSVTCQLIEFYNIANM